MKRVALVVLALAACDKPPPRAPVVGQEARVAVDKATKVYSDCIASRAASVPVKDQLAGNLVDAIVKACKPARALLVDEIIAFHRIGSPTAKPAYSAAVGEASVKAIDEPIASAAVVTIINRQRTETTGQ